MCQLCVRKISKTLRNLNKRTSIVLLFSKHHKIANAVLKTFWKIMFQKMMWIFQNNKIRSISKKEDLGHYPILWNRHIIKAKSQKLDTFWRSQFVSMSFQIYHEKWEDIFCTKKHRPHPIDPLTPLPSLFPAFGLLHLWQAPWCSPSLHFDPGLICNIESLIGKNLQLQHGN